jgi:hypothetical protein
MKPKNSAQSGDDGAAPHEANFSRQVSAIIDKYEKKFLPLELTRQVFDSDEAYNEHREEYKRELQRCQRELRLTRLYLLDDRPPIDDDDGEELKEMIANKLAVSLQNKAHPSDWWWTPADPSIQRILTEAQQSLEKETKSKAAPWRRGIFHAWSILSGLIYLAIVLGIFSAATSKFETMVFSSLVMIYNSVSISLSGVGLGGIYLLQRLEEAYGEIGRTLGLRVSVSPARKAAKQIARSSVGALIHTVSIGIGSLIALWHLVTAIVS